MLFKKRDIPAGPAHPGTPDALDGIEAVLAAERRVAHVTSAHPRWLEDASAHPSRSVWSPSRVADDGSELAGIAAGAAAAGLRATALSFGRTLSGMRDSLFASATQRLPYVVHHLAPIEDGSGRGGSWSDVADAGAVLMVPRNAQEASDFPLIARRVAEAALVPVVCLLDEILTGTSVQTLRRPDDALIEVFLGKVEDELERQTAAQQMLFGKRRRRVPALIDPDRALGSGMTYDGELAPAVVAAREHFFQQEISAITDAVLEEFARLTSRGYARASEYHAKDAEYLVIAHGGIVEELEAVADHLRHRHRLRAGVINLSVLRPFPGRVISHLLKGRRGVTVLDEHGGPLSDDGRLFTEIRTAVSRAEENGTRRKETPPFEGYAAYSRPGDRPTIYSAVYCAGSGGPTSADLRAVFENMLPDEGNLRRYRLGARFTRPHVRIPSVERRQQAVQNAYPSVDDAVVVGVPERMEVPTGCGTLQIRGDGGAMGRPLARALFHGAGWRVRSTTTDEGLCTIAHSPTGLPPEILRRPAECIVIADGSLLYAHDTIDAAADRATLIVNTRRTPEVVWKTLAPAMRRRIREKNLHILLLDARSIAADASSDVMVSPWLTRQALVGALLTSYAPLARDAHGPVAERYRTYVVDSMVQRPDLVAASHRAMELGGEHIVELRWDQIETEEHPVPEREAPHAVTRVEHHDETVFDLGHAWETTGFLIEHGRKGDLLPDPIFASRTAPARSSAFRRFDALTTPLPAVAAENCNGCGACWSWCPDAALVTSVHDLATYFQTAIDGCKKREQTLVHLPRLSQHLVKQAHRLLAGDELNRYLTFGSLLDDAFASVIEKMNPAADQREAIEAEFTLVRGSMADVAVVKTDAFFRGREKDSRGSGLIFSLTVDPDSCTSCGLCAEVCPEGAIEMMEPTQEILASARAAGTFMRALPEVPVEQLKSFVREDEPSTRTFTLINRKAAESTIGGDPRHPGSGVRTALRLAAGTVETAVQPAIEALKARIDALVDETRDRLQGKINGVVHIEDFETLGKRLSEAAGDRFDAATLASLLATEKTAEVERDTLQRLSNRLAELKRLQMGYRTGSSGHGRSRMTAFLGTGRTFRWQYSFPYNPYPFPWIYHLESDAAAVAEGAFEGVMRRMADTFRTLRLTRLQLDETYRPAEHDAFLQAFSWRDFSDEEWAACPPLLVITDRYTPQVERLLRSELPIKIVLVSPRSLEEGASAALMPEPGLSAIATGRSFVLQATPADPGHLMSGIEAGLRYPGPALFHLYAADPASHGIAPHHTADQTHRAVTTRTFPLFTFDPRRGGEMHERLSLDGNQDLQRDLAQRQIMVTLPNGLQREEPRPLTFGDWAVREGRFHHHFRFVPKKDWDDRMTPLSEYVMLSDEGRLDREPYVELPGGDSRPIRKIVSSRIVAETERCLATWRLLQEMSGVRSTLADQIRNEASAEMDETLAARAKELQAEFDARLAEQEATHAGRYQDILTRQLLSISGFGAGSERGRAAIRELLEGYVRTAEEER